MQQYVGNPFLVCDLYHSFSLNRKEHPVICFGNNLKRSFLCGEFIQHGPCGKECEFLQVDLATFVI